MALLVAALLAASPPLELTDANGTTHRLSDYRGKVVLLNFWATWCEPCRDELPSIERLRAALARKPFVVLAVQMGGSVRTAKDAAEDLGLRFPLLLDRDSRAGDPLGRFTLTDQDFAELTGIAIGIARQHAGGRVVSVLEGGYSLDGLPRAVASHLERLVLAS